MVATLYNACFLVLRDDEAARLQHYFSSGPATHSENVVRIVSLLPRLFFFLKFENYFFFDLTRISNIYPWRSSRQDPEI
jgi:hypothetical protein